MPSAATDSMIQASMQYNDSGAVCVNVFHGLIGDGDGVVLPSPTPADLKKAAGLFILAWYNSFRVRTDSQCALTAVDVVQTNPVAPVGTSASSDPTVTKGAISAGTGAQAACALVQWRTGVAVRGSNGRTYLPGMPASDTDDGRQLASSRQALWLDNAMKFYNGLIDPSTRSSWTAVSIDGVAVTIAAYDDWTVGLKVLHRAGTLAGQYSDIVSVRVPFPIAIQRRRMK